MHKIDVEKFIILIIHHMFNIKYTIFLSNIQGLYNSLRAILIVVFVKFQNRITYYFNYLKLFKHVELKI